MALNRELKVDDTHVQNGHWLGEEGPVRTLDQASVTIYGYGRIGQITASLCYALVMQVAIVDLFVKDALYPIVEKLEGAQSDFVINHMPLTKETENYFDERFFENMHPDAYFINVARGGCVDKEALLKALDQHMIAGCGLDVLADENPDLLHHPLLERNNVIITPHMAYYSRNSVKRLFEYCGQAAAYFLIHDKRYKQSVVKGS
jgi:D-3-phosphoglycerate dehydrogenase